VSDIRLSGSSACLKLNEGATLSEKKVKSAIEGKGLRFVKMTEGSLTAPVAQYQVSTKGLGG